MLRKITIAGALIAGLLVGAILGPGAVKAATDGYGAWRSDFLPSGGTYTTSLPSLATGEHNELHLDSSARLIVSVGANTAGATEQEVMGEIAHDAADANGPVKIGGKGSAAVASDVTEGDRVNGSFTLAGRFRVEDQAGYTAHDAADAGNPLKIGGKGSAAVASDVTEGDRVNASFTLAGRQRVEAGGDVAHDAADAGSPMKVGAKAISLTNTAEVSLTGDRANTVSDLYGRTRVVTHRDKDTWTANDTPATNVLAAVTKTASAGVKHVVTGFSASIASDGASTPAVMKVQIIEDNSGTPVIHWTEVISTVSTSGQGASIYRDNLYIVPNAANKSITLTFSVAGGTNTTQAVSMQGESFAP